MAGNGTTLVEAINEVVETIGEFPMSGTAPASTGTSIYSRARQFIERETTKLLTEGWPENTEEARKFDLSTGTAGELSLGAVTPKILRVRGAGPDKHRDLVLRTDGGALKVYDADQKSFVLTIRDGASNRTDVYLDVTVAIDFENLSPGLKSLITARARLFFQRRLQGNPSLDTMLQQEYTLAARVLDYNDPITEQSFNVSSEFQPQRTQSTNERAANQQQRGR